MAALPPQTPPSRLARVHVLSTRARGTDLYVGASMSREAIL